MESLCGAIGETKNQESLDRENLFLRYRSEGKNLEEEFSPGISEIVSQVTKYMHADSIESVRHALSNVREYPLGLSMDHFSYFSNKLITVAIDAGGRSGHVILFNANAEEANEDGEEVSSNMRAVIDNFVPYKPDRNKVSGVVWTSGGNTNGFGARNMTSHNGIWLSPSARGSGLGYGLYRLQENIFGLMKQEQAPTLSLLKMYLRLGFVPKAVFNPISEEKLNIDVEDALKDALDSNEERLRFNFYLERDFVPGQNDQESSVVS